MMIKRLIGFLLIIGAVGGILFSLIGLVELWRYRPMVTKNVVDNLALVDQTLSTTQQALTIVGQVVKTTTGDVAALQATSAAVAQAIQDTNPGLDSIIGLTGKDLPAAVTATQTSLASAQSSALVIDNVLTTLTSIPFLPVTAYAPAVPLHTALGQVSASLNTLKPALATINTSLVKDKTDINEVEAQLTQISNTTQGMSISLTDAQTVIDQYIAVTTQLKANIETAQRDAPAWITAISWIASLVLGWLVIAQLGLGIQGIDLMRGGQKRQ
jgi:hypothetical protein